MSNSEAALTKGKGTKKRGKTEMQKAKNPNKKEEESNDKPIGTKRKRRDTLENKSAATPRKQAKSEKTVKKITGKLTEKKNVLNPKVSSIKDIKKKTKVQEKTVKKRNPTSTRVKKEDKLKDVKSENNIKEDIKSENNIKEEVTSETTTTDESSGKAEEKVAVAKKVTKKKGVKSEPVPRPIKYESLGEGPPSVPSTGRMYVGCHVSGAGGIWNAFDNADECKAKSFALFLRNQRQWIAKPLNEVTIEKWEKAIKDMPPHLILPHGSYLMNLGSPDPVTLEKSRGMLLEEIQRCEKLGIPHYNFHPGSTVGKTSREECCKKIAESINLVLEQTKGVIFVLENMSCQGFTVGGDFHELRTIIENVNDRTRMGVCLDTCHAHAAGYDLGTEAGFQNLIDDFGKIVGWQFLRGLHVNDSKGKTGDHLDRHETIGRGTIGKEGFRRVMNCEYFKDLPIILETPWTSNEGYGKEIKILENLIAK